MMVGVRVLARVHVGGLVWKVLCSVGLRDWSQSGRLKLASSRVKSGKTAGTEYLQAHYRRASAAADNSRARREGSLLVPGSDAAGARADQRALLAPWAGSAALARTLAMKW